MIIKFEGRERFLSNFYTCSIEIGGIDYLSAEQEGEALRV